MQKKETSTIVTILLVILIIVSALYGFVEIVANPFFNGFQKSTKIGLRNLGFDINIYNYAEEDISIIHDLISNNQLISQSSEFEDIPFQYGKEMIRIYAYSKDLLDFDIASGNINLLSGNVPKKDSEVVIGFALAEKLKTQIGNTLKFQIGNHSYIFKVVGIFDSNSYIGNYTTCLTKLDLLRINPSDKVSVDYGFGLRLYDIDAISKLKNEIVKKISFGAKVVTYEELHKDMFLALDSEKHFFSFVRLFPIILGSVLLFIVTLLHHLNLEPASKRSWIPELKFQSKILFMLIFTANIIGFSFLQLIFNGVFNDENMKDLDLRNVYSLGIDYFNLSLNLLILPACFGLLQSLIIFSLLKKNGESA